MRAKCSREIGSSLEVGVAGASLLGEYARLILLVLAFPLVVLFGHCVANQQPRILCLIATFLLLSSLITSRGSQILRIGLLVAMALNVFALAIAPSDLFGKVDARWDWAANVLLFCLVTASFFEILAWAKSSPRKTLIKTLAWGMLAIPAIAYIVGVPLFEMLWDGVVVDEKKNALKDPNWSFFNEAALRAAKLFVFALFTYVGACIGSFLNVVAYCVPRGEAIGLRDSKCPACVVGSLRTRLGPWEDSPLTSSVNLPLELKLGENREVVLGGEGALLTGQVVATGRDKAPLDRNWSLNYLISRDRGVKPPFSAGFPKLGFDPSGPTQLAWLEPRLTFQQVGCRSRILLIEGP